MKPQAGDLLLAEPFMKDENFKRGVILLCEHNEEGSFGLVLNRKLDFNVTDVLPEFPVDDIELFYGGPVGQDTMHFVHTCGNMIENAREIQDGIFWSGNFEQITMLLETKVIRPDQIRFFIGYSGWSAGQLEEEMERNSWIIGRDIPDILMPQDGLWEHVLRQMGGDYEFVSTFPEDPQLN